MKNNYDFQNKENLVRRLVMCYIFVNLFVSDFVEARWILLSASEFNLL